ncbi:MAG TPA: hypothetical protein VK543_12735, partial [Puia sp.]|nr:hypothetical protein [Puia sp.]
MKKIFLPLLAFFICQQLFANARLPKIFGDNMVLQRNQAIPVWGWADPGEKITIQFNKQTKSVKTAKNGKWMIHLDAE